ncbi:MAG: oxidoreductase [Frankiales bacterium]|nr:oxidoreductase [Frankiales bacterium]
MTTTTAPRLQGAPRRPAPSTPGWWRSSTKDALAVSLLLVTVLWAVPHGVADLGGGASAALTSLGRLTGLVASDLLLVQVLLMARVPAIERAWGQDELARLHRLVGFGSFTLMLAHIGLVGLGYAGADGRGYAGVLGELWSETWDLAGMLLAVAGMLCLVMVVVTSVRKARAKLRYESWHLLHLYAYLGVGLALPHQLWTGADFLANPLATAYWWTAWAGTAACVVVFRLGLPLYRTLRHRLVVSAVVPEAPGVWSVHLSGRHLEELPARAGQFLQFRFLDGPGASRSHPYSLSAAPTSTLLRITVKDLGDGSRQVAWLRPGTRVLVEGPYGRMTAERRQGRKVLLLGAGIGITPLRALAEELPQGPGDVVVVHRVRSLDEAVFRGELEHLEQTRGLRAVLVPGPRASDDSWAPVGSGTDGAAALRALVPDVADRDVFVCGPDPWMDAALSAARQAGVPADRLHAERFTW